MSEDHEAELANRNLPEENFHFWLDWMRSQDRGVDLLRRLASFRHKRNPSNEKKRTAVYLVGPPEIGKTWCTRFLLQDGKMGFVTLNQKGVGRFASMAGSDIVWIEDCSADALTNPHDTEVLNAVIHGDPTEHKVHSQTQTIRRPVHVLVKSNFLPDNTRVSPGLRRRLDIYDIAYFNYKDSGGGVQRLPAGVSLAPLPLLPGEG